MTKSYKSNIYSIPVYHNNSNNKEEEEELSLQWLVWRDQGGPALSLLPCVSSCSPLLLSLLPGPPYMSVYVYACYVSMCERVYVYIMYMCVYADRSVCVCVTSYE